ncbi:MAG: hypothetical protein R3277_07645 [Brumimicrobium sp.]|nr:hypothetical protein [Brumimicrobium sp.]
MKRRIFHIILPVLGLMLFSCKKDELPVTPTENNPVFSVSGKIGNNQLDLSAGENDFFMHTGTFSWNGVRQFQGNLTSGSNNIEMQISDGLLDVPGIELDPDDFQSFSIAPNLPGDPLAVYSLQDFYYSQNITSLSWEINGEPYSGQQLKIFEPGRYQLCATVEFLNGNVATTCNEVIIGYQKNAFGVLKHLVTDNNKIFAFIDSPNNPIESVEWLVNDSLIGTGVDFKFTPVLSAFVLEAKIHYENGVYREKEVFIDVINNNFIEDFTVLENQANLFWDHKAMLKINYGGRSYIALPNSTGNDIIIDDVIPFQNNNSGQNVSILKGKFSGFFMDVLNQEIVEGDLNFSFGIAH